MHKLELFFIALFLTLFMSVESLCAQGKFIISTEPSNVDSPLEQLGIYLNRQTMGMPPFYIRQENLKAPGDYFRFPLGAALKIKTPQMQNEIKATLQKTIRDNYYDNFILDSIKTYGYRPTGDTLYRADCFIRYAQGDTIYVISGWLGKFLSFYRAVPGIIKYDYNALNKGVSKLTAFEIEIPKETFMSSSRDNPYFIEYISREKMTRIRCYHISEIVKVDQVNKRLITNPYTLIEITKFLDKDVMP